MLDFLARAVEIRECCTYAVGVQIVFGDVRVVFEAGADGGGDGRREDSWRDTRGYVEEHDVIMPFEGSGKGISVPKESRCMKNTAAASS